VGDKARSYLRDPRRNAARLVLAALLGFMVFLLAFAPMGGPVSGFAISQEQSPVGQQIRFLNPAEDTSIEISARADGVDSAYHLVAWVGEVPSSPVVEFQYQQGSDPTISIGTASRVGSSDTWELLWQDANLPDDGNYTLKAILFSGASEVSRHELAVEVNNQDGPASLPTDNEEQGETAELTYPQNAGPLGFFTSGSGDDQETNAIFDVSHSQDTPDDITAYYTVSAPGSDPEFNACGTEAPDDAADGIRCALDSDHSPEQVTAVAAVAEHLEFPLAEDPEDAADAHRVSPYVQIPTNVTINPPTQGNVAAPGSCSAFIAATVLDQQNRHIQGVNVDVHAQGPSDNLFFDDTDSSGDNTSAHQAPDEGGHTTERPVNCEADGEPPFNNNQTQGEHEQAPPTPDIKHIESVPGSTDDAGQFRFQLHSKDVGGTQFTAWADVDGNDLFCPDEPNGAGSIGWGQAAPAPTGVGPDEQTCPEPSPTASPTASPTTSPTSPPDDKCPGHENDPRNQVVGDGGDNVLNGTPGDDVICGKGGDDTIRGRGGDDLLLGGGGDDAILGNRGRDVLRGGSGSDVLRGGKDPDRIFGGRGPDILLGQLGKDLLRGKAGPDELRGGKKADRLFGNKGNDELRGGRGRDLCRGGAGTDQFFSCER
jgi:hypothetical protein